MIYEVSNLAIIIFVVIVVIVLGLSFYFARRTKSAKGYYAAGGTIHWGVNGIAFAGDYLSAASFLGICGMIAFSASPLGAEAGCSGVKPSLAISSPFSLGG